MIILFFPLFIQQVFIEVLLCTDNSGLIFLIPLLPLGCSLQISVMPASPNSLPVSRGSSISLQSHLLWCSWEGGHPSSSLLSSHSPPFLLSAAPHR